MDKRDLDRLLFSKRLLSEANALVVSEPDVYFVAKQVVTSHDAAEMAIAAIASIKGAVPGKPKTYLLDYLQALRQMVHPDRAVDGHDFFVALNDARIGAKHTGNFPNTTQWRSAAATTHHYISRWCQEYLALTLDDLDLTDLIRSSIVREYITAAKDCYNEQQYQAGLENVALALQSLFDDNAALSGFRVGEAKTEDALKLSGFGVHANDFLALQQLMPLVFPQRDDKPASTRWIQSPYGHPANWTERTLAFCIRTTEDIALKIQDAAWIPGAFDLQS